jgi:hypothetical protein
LHLSFRIEKKPGLDPVPSTTFMHFNYRPRRFLDLETLVHNILELRNVILVLLIGNVLGMERRASKLVPR